VTPPTKAPKKKPTAPCCCHYGAAVAGEWPEFECADCPVHQEAFGLVENRCRRHTLLFKAVPR
jgi:hypothetical protein